MIKLNIGNSYSRLEGLTGDQFKSIRKLVSYTNESYDTERLGFQYKALVKKYGPKPSISQRKYLKALKIQHKASQRPVYLIDKKGVFPSGLLFRVESWLKDYKLEVIDNRNLPRPRPERFKLSLGVTPYPLQLEALKACKGADRGVISACTGFGKSLMIAMLIDQFQLKTLIVVPNIELKRQLGESIKAWFGDTGGLVVVENIDSPKLKEFKDFDLLIIDEAHHSAAATYRKLNKTAWSGIYYRFCFTATPFRTKSEETLLMESITSKILYEITYKDALKAKAVVPVEAYYLEIPASETDSTTWAGVYCDLVVNNEVRNQAVISLLASLAFQKVSTLCLVKEIAHGEILSCSGAFPFVNGKDADSREWIGRFNAKEVPAIVATTGVCGEGVDTKPCEYVVIPCLGKSKVAFMQWVGRAIRIYPGKDSAKVIIFKDHSHRFTLSHFKEQVKILVDTYGVTPVRLEL